MIKMLCFHFKNNSIYLLSMIITTFMIAFLINDFFLYAEILGVFISIIYVFFLCYKIFDLLLTLFITDNKYFIFSINKSRQTILFSNIIFSTLFLIILITIGKISGILLNIENANITDPLFLKNATYIILFTFLIVSFNHAGFITAKLFSNTITSCIVTTMLGYIGLFSIVIYLPTNVQFTIIACLIVNIYNYFMIDKIDI